MNLKEIFKKQGGMKLLGQYWKDQPGRDQRIAALQFEIHRRRGLSLL